MCGIIGIITKQPREQVMEALTRGARSMAHRGPDDEGLELVNEARHGLTVGFGHRRLSILDLSPAGHQPMCDETTGNWITFNGEVFNFQEIRQQLESRGLRFHTRTDTEVILKGLGELGLKAIDAWRGMFAAGWWEPKQQRLTLVRDRLGIKPLYYYHRDDLFIFASEVRALLQTGLVPRRLSWAALESYLAYGAVQQPLTMIENVYSVLPGHALVLENGELRDHQYWKMQAEPDFAGPADEGVLVEEIRALLEEAVRLRMVADVPVAAFLSGGIDSGAVVSLMRRVTNGTIKTFSVYFHEREFSEHSYAEQIARKYNAEHHPVLLTEQDILAKVPFALRAMDQPSVDGMNTYVVSEAVAQAGLKVALSGLGGDEVFAGYSFFKTVGRDEQHRLLARRLPRSLRQTIAATVSTIASGSRAAKISSALRGSLDDHSVLLYRQLFTEEQRDNLLDTNGFRKDIAGLSPDFTPGRAGRWQADYSVADPVNQASIIDLGGYLSNTLLRDTDAMSMAHGLEARVPLIDHKVVECLLRIPGRIKVRDNRQKWLLVEAVGDLPQEIVTRPKHGFELPFKNWLTGALRAQVEDALHLPILNDLLRPGTIQTLWRKFETGEVTWSRIWSLYVLGSWLELNICRESN